MFPFVLHSTQLYTLSFCRCLSWSLIAWATHTYASLAHPHDGLTAALLAATHAQRGQIDGKALCNMLWHCAVTQVPLSKQIRELFAECSTPQRLAVLGRWSSRSLSQLMQAYVWCATVRILSLELNLDDASTVCAPCCGHIRHVTFEEKQGTSCHV